jgi:hypothetical protein
MPHKWPLGGYMKCLPPGLVKSYIISLRSNGEWRCVIHEAANRKRSARHTMGFAADAVRLTVTESYGAEDILVFSMYI